MLVIVKSCDQTGHAYLTSFFECLLNAVVLKYKTCANIEAPTIPLCMVHALDS